MLCSVAEKIKTGVCMCERERVTDREGETERERVCDRRDRDHPVETMIDITPCICQTGTGHRQLEPIQSS